MKLIDYIVCDDVRHEIGGKLSLMGTFGETINLQIRRGAPKPINFPISLYLRILLEDGEVVPDSFSVVVSLDGKEFANIQGDIETPKQRPKILGFVLPIKMFQVSGNASMSVTASFSSGGNFLAEFSSPYNVAIQLVEN